MADAFKLYEAAQKAIKTARENARKIGKQAFNEASADLFEKFPEMDSFSWHQYTPYFNDGDTCEFGVSADEDSVSVNENRLEDIIEADYSYPNSLAYDAEVKLKGKPYRAVAKFVGVFDEDTLKDLFGDHAEVLVKRNGKINISDYHHD